MKTKEFEKKWKEMSEYNKFVKIEYGNGYKIVPESYTLTGDIVSFKTLYYIVKVPLNEIKEIKKDD